MRGGGEGGVRTVGHRRGEVPLHRLDVVAHAVRLRRVAPADAEALLSNGGEWRTAAALQRRRAGGEGAHFLFLDASSWYLQYDLSFFSTNSTGGTLPSADTAPLAQLSRPNLPAEHAGRLTHSAAS